MTTKDKKILEKLKKGVSQVESRGGELMYNLQGGSATGLYGQLFNSDYLKNVPYMKGVSRKQFAEDLDLQNRLFEDTFYGKIKDVPGLKSGIDKIRKDYPKESANVSDDEIAALVNFIGRDGTREYFGYHIRDGKPLAEALPNVYGPDAKFKNKTPEEYLNLYREAVGTENVSAYKEKEAFPGFQQTLDSLQGKTPVTEKKSPATFNITSKTSRAGAPTYPTDMFFESDNTRVAPFNPVPTTGGVASWDEFMESYNQSGLPAEGFARGGQVIKNNNMKYNNYKYGGMHYGVPQYFLGGAFEKLTGKKFKDTGFGKGLRDFGVATLNTAASPFESLMGTDFGIDEKFGYKTKFGNVFGGIGETAGSMLGQLAPTALNTIAPGAGTALSMVGQSFGSGLEGAGITQDISTDPQSSMGSQFGGMLNMMAMMNPSGGAGQFTQNMGESGFMQGLGQLFSGQMKHGGMNYKYGQGGMPQQADVEVESGEVIQTQGGAPVSYNSKAPVQSIGASGFKVGGKESHAKGGVPMTMPNGETKVFSKKNAADAERLLKLIAQAEKGVESSDFITRSTAELDLKKHTRQLEEKFAQQQEENGNQTNANTTMAKRGLWANIHAKRERIAGGSGERMRTPGSKGAPTNEAIKNSQARYGMQYMKAKHGMQHTVPPSSNPDSLGITPRDINLEDIIARMQQTDLRNRQLNTLEGLKTKGNIFSSPPFDPKIYTNSPANLPFREGGLVKAQDGMGLSLNNPAFGSGNNFGIPGFSSTPGANTFNSMYGGGANTGTGGGLQVNTPSQYEQVPFQSQYSGMKGMLPYASSLMNLGIGLKGLKDPGSFDASKYMINPELKNTQLNKDAMIAPDMQAYTSALNSVQDPRYKTMIHSNFMPQLAKRSEGIEFLQQKLEGENVDTINKFKGLNARTQYGVDMKNAELAALPYQFLGQAASDITSTSQQMGQNKFMERMLHNMYPQYRKVNS